MCFRVDRINCVSPLTPSDCQELSEIVKNAGAKKLFIGLEQNSPDTVKRLCELCPERVFVELSERGGVCSMVTFSPHNINMWSLDLYPGDLNRLTQLLSLSVLVCGMEARP